MRTFSAGGSPLSRRRLLAAGAASGLVVLGRPGRPGSAFGSSPPSTQPLDSASIPALIAAMSIERMMSDITTLAATPRHPVENFNETLGAADYIDAEFAAVGLDVHRIEVEEAGVTLPVVWAELGPGGETPTFVVTAHYDTVAGSPGADDDASGCAGVLEIARVLAGAIGDGLALATTVVVGALPFEEYGPPYPASRALGESLLADGRPLSGMLSTEMIGYASPAPTLDDPGDALLLLGYEGAEDLVAQFADAAERFASLPTGGGTFPADTDFIDRSDHAAFHALGVPAMFATDGANFRTPHYHQPTDTPDSIVQPFLLGSAQTILGGLCLHSLATATRR